MDMGGTLKGEILRTADEVERISKEKDIFFTVAYLKDIGYVDNSERYELLMDELESRLISKNQKRKREFIKRKENAENSPSFP